MKKLVLVMCAVLALSATVDAATKTESFTVEFKGGHTWINGVIQTPTNPVAPQIKVTSKGSGDGWSAEADFDHIHNWRIKSFKVDAKDGNFALTIWGGRDLADKQTPFGWVKSVKAGGTWKARGVYDFLTVDTAQTKDVWAFAEKKVNNVTVGGAYNTQFGGSQVLDAYATVVAGPATVTGEFALNSVASDKNWEVADYNKVGAKADVKATDSIKLYAEAKKEAAKWGDVNYVTGKVTYTPVNVWGQVAVTDNSASKKDTASWKRTTEFILGHEKDWTKFDGKYTMAVDKDDVNKGTTLTGTATYRTSKQDWRYLFNNTTDSNAKYYQTTGMAAQVSFTTTASSDADKAKNTVVAKYVNPVIAGKAMVAAAVTLVSDQDGGLTYKGVKTLTDNEDAIATIGGASAKSQMTIEVDGRYIVNKKWTLDGAARYATAGDDNWAMVGVKATYAMNSAATLNASFNQELAEVGNVSSERSLVKTGYTFKW